MASARLGLGQAGRSHEMAAVWAGRLAGLRADDADSGLRASGPAPGPRVGGAGLGRLGTAGCHPRVPRPTPGQPGHGWLPPEVKQWSRP